MTGAALELKELDRVARRILDEDLAAAGVPRRSRHPEPRPLSSEALNGRVEIRDDDLEPIPASGSGNPTGFARATHAGLVEKQSQVIPRQADEPRGQGECRRESRGDCSEVDHLVDVCDEIPDGRLCHVTVGLGLPILIIVRRKPSLPVVIALVASLRRTVENRVLAMMNSSPRHVVV